MHLWTARPPLLLNHLLQWLHRTAPLWSSMELILSLLHLCLFMSPGLLKHLPHSLHCTAWSSSVLCLVSLPPGTSSSTGNRGVLFLVEHLCTARPPLLRNHLLQCGHLGHLCCETTCYNVDTSQTLTAGKLVAFILWCTYVLPCLLLS